MFTRILHTIRREYYTTHCVNYLIDWICHLMCHEQEAVVGFVIVCVGFGARLKLVQIRGL